METIRRTSAGLINVYYTGWSNLTAFSKGKVLEMTKIKLV